jgi:ankyrin repeat protein
VDDENSDDDDSVNEEESRESSWMIAMYMCKDRSASILVRQHNGRGMTPLHYACSWEDPEQGLGLVVALLKAGADPNARSIRRGTYYGGMFSKKDSRTGEISAIRAAHRTPLHYAVEAGNKAIVKKLLERNDVTVNIRDGDSCTPLFLALDEGEDEIASLLLENGASPNEKGGNADIGMDNTLLAWASSKRRKAHVEMLLSQGARPNIPGKNGMYPLHMAARCASRDVLSALLAAGADPALKDSAGKTPLEIALSNPTAAKNGVTELLAKAAKAGPRLQ